MADLILFALVALAVVCALTRGPHRLLLRWERRRGEWT